jgi:toxin-antitoxin system PIN domain toxin
VYVIDLNVCLYAVNSDSAHHAGAKAFLEEVLNGEEPVALPWVVVLGFLRVATNPRILPAPLEPEDAIALVDGWLQLPVVELLQPGREHWPLLKALLAETGTAANLTTDAHLAALAIENGAQLASFDADFQRFKRLRWVRPG